MQTDQGQRQGFRSKANEGANLLYFLADVPATTLTPFIRAGFGINANGWNGVGALVLLVLWACADPHDPAMGCYLVLWLLALLFQKAHTLKLIRRGEKIHSRYGGDPWLALKVPFVRRDDVARRFEPVMCFVIGIVLLCAVSEALGALWMVGFATLSIRQCVEHALTDARVQAMDDAEIEGRYYAEVRQRRGRVGNHAHQWRSFMREEKEPQAKPKIGRATPRPCSGRA